MRSKKHRKKLVVQITIILFFVLLIAASYLVVKLRNAKGIAGLDGSTSESQDHLVWIKYENKDYGFSFDRPKFLKEYSSVGKGGYEVFITFLETEFSTAKAVRVGVRKNSLEDEVKRLKEDLESEFDVELVAENKIKIDGHDAIKLDYKPNNPEELESRSFVIINKGEHSISISTVPEQIKKLINSFKFM